MRENNKLENYRDQIKQLATENNKLENYRDQLKLLEVDLDMAEENRKMFFRLCEKWTTESQDIQIAIHRLKEQIKNTPQ